MGGWIGESVGGWIDCVRGQVRRPPTQLRKSRAEWRDLQGIGATRQPLYLRVPGKLSRRFGVCVIFCQGLHLYPSAGPADLLRGDLDARTRRAVPP